MLKKLIEFEDLDGNMVKDEFYFNLSKSELLEMELEEGGGLLAKIEKLTRTENARDALHIFKVIVARSVGQRNDDGRTFDKTPDIIRKFMQTNAYDVLLFELATDARAGAEFVKGVLPKDIQGRIDVTDVVKNAEAELARRKTGGKLEVREMVLDPSSQAGNVHVMEGKGYEPAVRIIDELEPKPEARRRTLADFSQPELEDMSYSELEELIKRESGNVDKNILLLAMKKAHSRP